MTLVSDWLMTFKQDSSLAAGSCIEFFSCYLTPHDDLGKNHLDLMLSFLEIDPKSLETKEPLMSRMSQRDPRPSLSPLDLSCIAIVPHVVICMRVINTD